MKQATVILPFAGAVQVFLTDLNGDETDEELIERAMSVAEMDVKPVDAKVCDPLEWDYYPQTGAGNVTYLAYNRASVEWD